MSDFPSADNITAELVAAGVAGIETLAWSLSLPEMMVGNERADHVLVYEVLEAALRGRMVVDRPEPDARTDELLVWTVVGEDGWSATVEATVDKAGPAVVWDRSALASANARALGLALIAAADRADRMAAEPGEGGGNRG